MYIFKLIAKINIGESNPFNCDIINFATSLLHQLLYNLSTHSPPTIPVRNIVPPFGPAPCAQPAVPVRGFPVQGIPAPANLHSGRC